MLAKSSGSLRFELVDGNAVERWRVDVDHGDIAVSHKAGAADCVLRVPKLLFLKIASGRDNAIRRGIARRVGRRRRPRPAHVVRTHIPGTATEYGSDSFELEQRPEGESQDDR